MASLIENVAPLLELTGPKASKWDGESLDINSARHVADTDVVRPIVAEWICQMICNVFKRVLACSLSLDDKSSERDHS
jgi:hypothetical protein